MTQGLPKVEQVLELCSIDSILMDLEKRVKGGIFILTRNYIDGKICITSTRVITQLGRVPRLVHMCQ